MTLTMTMIAMHEKALMARINHRYGNLLDTTCQEKISHRYGNFLDTTCQEKVLMGRISHRYGNFLDTTWLRNIGPG